MGETDLDPERFCVPVHPLLAVQEVLLVLLHLSVEDLPIIMLVDEAVKVSVGAN